MYLMNNMIKSGSIPQYKIDFSRTTNIFVLGPTGRLHQPCTLTAAVQTMKEGHGGKLRKKKY